MGYAVRRRLTLLSTLAAGGTEAIPAIQAILGGERLLASKDPKGGWLLKGSVMTAHLLDAVAPGAVPAPETPPRVEDSSENSRLVFLPPNDGWTPSA